MKNRKKIQYCKLTSAGVLLVGVKMVERKRKARLFWRATDDSLSACLRSYDGLSDILAGCDAPVEVWLIFLDEPLSSDFPCCSESAASGFLGDYDWVLA